ncbi:MAG: exodeoxyribonuclease III [Cryobacterium sp.]|nr:exodeoxyribonuclease III [Oligoflexia bacterium]
MKIQSWNVNGIRAAQKKGFEKWFSECGADVVCLQETKANPDQLDAFLLKPEGYFSYWHSAEKLGYSGTAIYSREEPLRIVTGMGIPEFDREGRVLIAEYERPGLNLAVICAYFPNSQREHTRLGYKLAFCEAMLALCQKYVAGGKDVVLCGDFNIAHEDIDLKNPKTNRDNAGFLPEERAWMTKFLAAGFVDSFRHFEKGPGHYTWWSYRPGVREKNIGWRLDYHCVNAGLVSRMVSAKIHPAILGSDHCPVELELRGS